jgi:hypothetical protein
MEGPQPKPKAFSSSKLHKQPVTSRWFTIGVNALLLRQKQMNKTDS